MPVIDGKIRNPERTRFYGLDVNDRVMYNPFGLPKQFGKVVELGYMDNNRVAVLFDGETKPSSCVAEWCTRVNDKGWPLNKIIGHFLREFYPHGMKMSAKRFNYILSEFKEFELTDEQAIGVIMADNPKFKFTLIEDWWYLTTDNEQK